MIDFEKICAAVDDLAPVLKDMAAEMGVQGFIVRAVHADGRSKTLSGGKVRAGSDIAPDEDTVFMIGSCSKSFAAAAAIALAERGALDLDAPISRYLPFGLERKGVAVTTRHLLRHASGLPNLGLSEIVSGHLLYGRIPGDYEGRYPFDGSGSILPFVEKARDELVGVPGGQYIYSNEGFCLVAEIVAAVSGKDYADAVRELLFEPLGMRSSGFREKDFAGRGNVASGHKGDGSPVPPYFAPVIAGAGGILSTVSDLTRYVLMMMNGGQGEHGKVLAPSSVDALEECGIAHRTAESLIGKGLGPEFYGLGWMVYPDFLGTKAVTHAGSTAIFSANLYYNNDLGFGLSGLCNHGEGEALLELFAFMASAKALGKDPFEVFPVFALKHRIKELEGIYSGYANAVSARISFEKGLLWWLSIDGNKNSPQGARPLTLVDGDSSGEHFLMWNDPGAASEVTFFIGDDGRRKVMRDRNVLSRIAGLQANP